MLRFGCIKLLERSVQYENEPHVKMYLYLFMEFVPLCVYLFAYVAWPHLQLQRLYLPCDSYDSVLLPSLFFHLSWLWSLIWLGGYKLCVCLHVRCQILSFFVAVWSVKSSFLLPHKMILTWIMVLCCPLVFESSRDYLYHWLTWATFTIYFSLCSCAEKQHTKSFNL